MIGCLKTRFTGVSVVGTVFASPFYRLEFNRSEYGYGKGELLFSNNITRRL